MAYNLRHGQEGSDCNSHIRDTFSCLPTPAVYALARGVTIRVVKGLVELFTCSVRNCTLGDHAASVIRL